MDLAIFAPFWVVDYHPRLCYVTATRFCVMSPLRGSMVFTIHHQLNDASNKKNIIEVIRIPVKSYALYDFTGILMTFEMI